MAKSPNPFAGRSHQNTGAMSSTRAMLAAAIETPGLDEMITRLQKYAAIGDTDAKRVRNGMNETVKLALGEANKTVPYRLGNLKRSLFGKVKAWAEGNVTGSVGSNWLPPRGLIGFTLEGGRRPNQRGRMGITPRRWLYHAYSRIKEQVDAIWQKTADKITKDLARK